MTLLEEIKEKCSPELLATRDTQATAPSSSRSTTTEVTMTPAQQNALEVGDV